MANQPVQRILPPLQVASVLNRTMLWPTSPCNASWIDEQGALTKRTLPLEGWTAEWWVEGGGGGRSHGVRVWVAEGGRDAKVVGGG